MILRLSLKTDRTLVTTSERLGIMGGSNGGLLVGVTFAATRVLKQSFVSPLVGYVTPAAARRRELGGGIRRPDNPSASAYQALYPFW